MAKHHFNSYLRLMQLVGKDEGLQTTTLCLKICPANTDEGKLL